jgi:periplasmic divalent cation tolerance protein
MPRSDQHLYVSLTTTLPDETSARELARKLVEEKYVACAQMSKIESIYCWEGQTHVEPEVRLVLKTRAAMADYVMEVIRNKHPYEVPQIIHTAIEGGNQDYFDWMDDATAQSKNVNRAE